MKASKVERTDNTHGRDSSASTSALNEHGDGVALCEEGHNVGRS